MARVRSRPPTSARCRGVRIVDPGASLLFTLQDDRDLNVELYVNKGRGYVESDQHPSIAALPSIWFASIRSTTRFAARTSRSPRRASDSAPTTIASR